MLRYAAAVPLHATPGVSMLRRPALFLAALASIALAAPAAPAAAADPAPAGAVTLHMVFEWNDAGLWKRDFTLAGAVTDAGRARERLVSERPVDGAVVRRVRYVLTSASGRLVIGSRQRVTENFDEFTARTRGRWWVVSGSGAYAGVTGGGTFDETQFASGWYVEHTWPGTLAPAA